MIIFQIILIAGLALVFWWFLARSNTYHVRAWTKIFMMLFVLVAVIAIIFPDSSNRAAHWFGITRGADFLLYLLTLAFIFVVLNGYIKGKQDEKKLVVLARKIALLEAEIKNKKR
jgi:hypothetical protein